MNTIGRVLFMLATLIFFSGKLVVPALSQTSTSYFPLAEGNWWQLAYTLEPPDMPADTLFINTAVSSQLELGGSPYFLLTYSFIDSDTLRMDEDGRVWSWGYGQEDLLLDFTAHHDSVYQFPATRDSDVDTLWYDVQVSRDVTVETYAGTFENCIHFSFDIPAFIDDEIGYTFAPGVGLVHISGAWQYGRLFAAQVGDSAIVAVVSNEDHSEQLEKTTFDIYPNPVQQNSRVSVTLETATEVTLEVFDMLGRRVLSSKGGHLSSGSHSIPLEAESLAPAVYFIRMKTAKGHSVGQLFLRN